MIDLLLAKVSPVMSVIGLLWVFVAIVLILIVLIQKGRGGGLSSAFGGGGAASSLLGTKTGDFLTWITITLVVMFLLLSIVMAKFYRPQKSEGLATPSAPIGQVQPLGGEPEADVAAEMVDEVVPEAVNESIPASEDTAVDIAEPEADTTAEE